MRHVPLWVIFAIALIGCQSETDKAERQKPPESQVPQSAAVPLFGGQERKLDDAFHFATGGEPKSCDPHKITSVIENHIVGNAFEGLVTWGPQGPSGGMKPGMADQWEITDDGKVYTFHIRQNAKWSDGTPLTAKDFEWSWNRARSKELAALYNFLYDEGGIERFEATDDTTFVVTLKAPNRIFESVLTFPTFFPVPRHTIEQHGDAWCRAQNFVGNGPYRVIEEKLGETITLTANLNYHIPPAVPNLVAHTPDQHKLIADLYASGKLDWIGAQATIPSDALITLFDDKMENGFRNADLSSHPLMAVSYVSINTKRGVLGKPLVRRALALAIDRSNLSNTVLLDGSVPTGNFVPPGLGSYQPIMTDTAPNCEEAKRLLTEAGFPGGANFPKFEFLFRTNSSREPDVASAIADQWRTCLAIEVTTVGMEMKLWQGKVSEQKDYDLTLSRWLGDYPHPQTFMALLVTGNPQNDGAFSSPAYDTAVTEGMAAMDDATLQAAYGRAEAEIAALTPVIPLHISPRIHAVRPEWSGIVNNTAQYHPLRFLQRVGSSARSPH